MYPSDITRKQFETIRPWLESMRKKTKLRKLDLYDVFNALLYVMVTGCQWRALPKDYPKYGTVHQYFCIWSEDPGFPDILKKLVGKERMKYGRKRKTSFCIVDAQSVKNTDTAREKGYDVWKGLWYQASYSGRY